MKKHILPLVAVVVVLSSCTAAYKTGQTPDDVYYSEGKVVVDAERNTTVREREEEDGYTSYWNNAEDDYLRMKVRNGNRWNTLDDYAYWNGFNNMSMMGAFNHPFGMGRFNNGFGWNNGFGFNNGWGWNNGWNNNWNNNFFWNNSWNGGWNNGFNNQWGCNQWGANNQGWNNRPIVYVPGGKNFDANRNTFRPNLGGYNNTSFDRGNNRGNKFFNSGTSSNGNGLYRSIFGNGNNSSGSSSSGGSSTYDRPARSLGSGSGSSSSSSSSGSSGSSGGGGSSRSSGGGGASRGGRG
ncbi:MAG: hypothetical protein EAY75_16655 [Bacteroidetes bacterium]|nr:MAG: hypothetical protein EAY75_16655 [Bacteroidota bacterium]